MLRAFAARLPARARVADLGCGPGWFAKALAKRGRSVVALDFSAAMLRAARENAPGAALVRGDLASLPFARESLAGAWAKNTYIHLPFRQLAGALAELHRALRPGARLTISLFERAELGPRGFAELRGEDGSALDGRLFTMLSSELARDLLDGRGLPRHRGRARPALLAHRDPRANARRRAAPGARAPGRRAEPVADRRGDRASRSRARTTASGPPRCARAGSSASATSPRRCAAASASPTSPSAPRRARTRCVRASTASAPRAWSGSCARSGRAPSCSSGSTASAAPSIRARVPGPVRGGFARSPRLPRALHVGAKRRGVARRARPPLPARARAWRSSWLYWPHAVSDELSRHAALRGGPGRVRRARPDAARGVPRDHAGRGHRRATSATSTTRTCT